MKATRTELEEMIELYRDSITDWRDVSEKLDIEVDADNFILEMAMRGIENELKTSLDMWFNKLKTDGLEEEQYKKQMILL